MGLIRSALKFFDIMRISPDTTDIAYKLNQGVTNMPIPSTKPEEPEFVPMKEDDISEASQLEEKLQGMLEDEMAQTEPEDVPYIPETNNKTVVQAMTNAINKQLDSMAGKLATEEGVLAASRKRKHELELAIMAFESAMKVLEQPIKDSPIRDTN